MRTAILSLHSHSDRSFLDDRDLAVLSGELRAGGHDNDLVVVVLDELRGVTAGEPNERVLDRLIETLAPYDVVAFQRIWSGELARELRDRMPEKTLVLCAGEHEVDALPVDFTCRSLARLLEWLPDRHGEPPVDAPGQPGLPFTPNLAPVLVNPDALPAFRSFTILGNEGCPYQADARDNPIYEGVAIPESYGRGCAFCTTGNHYERRVGPDDLGIVLEQLLYLTRHESGLRHFVLKDQNPFGYLTELVEECARRGVRPFTLLLETRADWFLKNEQRFARALAAASDAGYEIAPYLVGIESFSQAELDRFNKGITVETNDRFLTRLREWKETHGDALNLEHASFGFVLFTPWTTLEDLRASYEGIARTRFDQLRGKILLSRARLYHDNALHHLAKRDGLLLDAFGSRDEDNAVRFGYLPAHPWRFAHADVARFSDLATELAEESGGHDELTLFRALLEAFETAGAESVTAADVRARIQSVAASRRPATHEWKLHLFEGDALENRALGRARRNAPRPLEDVELELAGVHGAHRIILAGGRPTEHPRFREIATRARTATTGRLTLETDGGSFEDPGALEAVEALGIDELFVHVASIKEPAHTAVLGSGTARSCLEGIARACASGIATYAVIPVARANAEDVLSLVEWLRRLPARPLGVLLAFPDASQLSWQDRGRVVPPRAAARLSARVFDKCRAHSLELGFRSKRGISACASGGALDRWGTVFHDRRKFFKHTPAGELVRVGACGTCSLSDSCSGIERPLVALFGEEYLSPIPLEVSMDWKLTSLSSLDKRDYKNISPFKNAGGARSRGLLRVNGHCNMSCAFCFVDRTAPDFATDGLRAEVDQMTAAGTRHIVLSGGEPTLHPDLPALIRHARARGATTIEIQTNGVRAADLAYATELVDAGLDKATVSLHSPDPDHSNRITRLPKAFDKTVRALHNFRQLGVETQVAHVITKANYEDLPRMMRFLGEELPSSEAHLSVCLAIAQGISDLVYSWVVPSFTEIRPYVRAALDFCLENDIGFGGMIGQGGYPPCMLDGELKYYTRAYEHLYISEDWRDQFHKAESCRECAFDAHCLGVRKAYVECYGDAELRPFQAVERALPAPRALAGAAPADLVTLRASRNAR